MIKSEKFKKFIEYFSITMPDASTELHYKNPYELTVAVILSAQCTDKRVNMVTPSFFKKYKDFYSLSKANLKDISKIIKSISYPNNKSKNLLALAKTIVSKYNGQLPQRSSELEKLPGIGRKTANVLASVLFNEPVMPVDTHVFRVSERIGLTTNAKNTLDAEKQLTKYLPENKINLAHHWLILHGRYICKARKPLCEKCGISNICDYYNKHFR